MQFKQRYRFIVLGCMILLSGVVLFINVWAQAPEKAQITFFSDRDGNLEIYVMDVDGNNPRNLTNNPAEDTYPSWFDPDFARPVFPNGKLRGTWGWIKQTSR